MRTRGWFTSSPCNTAWWPARSMATAPAANCASISAYATAWLPAVLRHAAAIWLTIACTASPTALSSSGIASTICLVGYPPSLGLLLPLRCHGAAPLSTVLPPCFPIALLLLLRMGATPHDIASSCRGSFPALVLSQLLPKLTATCPTVHLGFNQNRQRAALRSPLRYQSQ